MEKDKFFIAGRGYGKSNVGLAYVLDELGISWYYDYDTGTIKPNMKVDFKINIDEQGADWVKEMNDENITIYGRDSFHTSELKELGKDQLLAVIKGLVGELVEARSLAEDYFDK